MQQQGKEGRTEMKKLYILMLSLFLISGVFCFESCVWAAEQYPVKPITFIVPLEAGSDGDVLARPILQKVSAILGQPIMVVNKPGAGSSIGYREVHDAKPDGYTIGGAFATIVTNKLQGIMPYDHRDFTIIGTYATYIPIVVGSTKTKRPFKTMEEALSFAKSNPEDVSIATSGVGQSWWIATMAFQAGTGLKFNIIPQPGAGAFAIAQASGGHTDLAVLALGAAKPQIEAGNVRLLAVYGAKRASPPYDKVPTFKDLGYDIFWESTQTVIAPPKMPRDIAEKLAKAFETAANDPEYKKLVVERNAFSFITTLEKSVQFLDEQRKVARSIMEKAGILKEK
jgi:tripartite-type tricarboxylate transporter receptor subunit TctC